MKFAAAIADKYAAIGDTRGAGNCIGAGAVDDCVDAVVVVGADVRKRSRALALVLAIRRVLRGRRTRGRPHRCERDDDSNDEKSDERV